LLGERDSTWSGSFPRVDLSFCGHASLVFPSPTTNSSGSHNSSHHHNTSCKLFVEMAKSDFYEWRSPNRVLEVTIHRICYPITNSILSQVFGQFGGMVEQILDIGGTDVVMAIVVFDSVETASDAYGELHSSNIYDDCCQMHMKWGFPSMPARDVDKGDSTIVLTIAPSVAALVAPTTPPPPSSPCLRPLPSTTGVGCSTNLPISWRSVTSSQLSRSASTAALPL
jgi:hypothetical protein